MFYIPHSYPQMWGFMIYFKSILCNITQVCRRRRRREQCITREYPPGQFTHPGTALSRSDKPHSDDGLKVVIKIVVHQHDMYIHICVYDMYHIDIHGPCLDHI